MSEQINNLLRPGDEFEKFVIERELGHGGMGAVYLVRHRVLDSEFALKVLYPEIAKRDKQFVDRFIREARLAGRIHHPNLIAVHDAGYNERSGMHYLVMDYVPGVSLRKRIKQDKRIPLSEALSIIRQCADALKAAQQFNMVHRDIKPDNIMFGAHGEVRLADLGIAKASGDKEANLTQEAAVFGTPSYMSPEQAKDSSHVDTRADIFSLGVVLFEMLTGTRPFSGSSTVEILVSVISDEPAPSVLSLAPDIPADVAKLVADMLAKDLSKRIASPTELIRRIDALKLPKDTATDNNDDDEAFVTAPTMVNAVSAPSSKPNSTPTAASLEEPPQVTMPTAVPATPQQPSETPVPASSRPRLQLKSTMHTEVPATPQPSQVQSADTPQQPMPTELPEVTMPTAMPATPQQSPAPQQQSASEIPASSATSEANAEQPEQTMDMPAAAIPATATRSRKLIPILIVVAVLVLVLMISSGIILFGILTRKSGSDKPLSAESTPLSIETSTTPVADGSKQENQSSKTEQPTQKEQTPQQGTQVQTDKQDKQEQQTPKQE
ncbi:MAG: protein kinase, partial [Victivallales bacterium]|nr:protein kinase [Victivallales bacterium]